MSDAVDRPAHYLFAGEQYSPTNVIRAWQLGFSLGNVVKYIARAGKKDPAKHVEDLKKAAWYLNEEIEFLERGEWGLRSTDIAAKKSSGGTPRA
jgi:hypothetical protein